MEFADIAKNRRSIRQYKELAIREATIHELLEIISLSVSALNLQPWKIKVVSDPETKDKLAAAAFGMNHVGTCSHLLVLCADIDHPALIEQLSRTQAAAGVPEDKRQRTIDMATNLFDRMTPEERLQWSREQVYLALGNAINGAYSLGLAACPVTAFQPDEFARILELPPTAIPTALVCVGYAAEDGAPKLRYPLGDILI